MYRFAKSSYSSSLKIGKAFHTSKSMMKSDTFLHGSNSVYLDQMYDNWVRDKKSVHPSWDAYFTNITKGLTGEQAFIMPPEGASGQVSGQRIQPLQPSVSGSSPQLQQQVTNSFKIYNLVLAFMARGHEKATVDPLNLNPQEEQSGVVKLQYQHNELDYRHYGFTEEDLNKEFYINPEHAQGILKNKQTWKLSDLIDTLKKIYCGNIGFEYTYIGDKAQRNWLAERIEKIPFEPVSKEQKILIFNRLCSNECFNNFLKNKFTTSKRFGIEGCDTMISGLDAIVDRAVEHKVDRIVIGMPHRGRLNTLAEVIGKKYEEILCEFQENLPIEQEGWGNTGDVKYHLGTTSDRRYANGHVIRLSMLPNPSHLEAIDPLIQGKTRAYQDYIKDFDGHKQPALEKIQDFRSFGIAIHGDAALAGQGVVYETLQMWNLQNYKIGGTIHIACNNQIGFTTIPRDARSGLYCTDIAKSIEAPVFHVNADEPEHVDIAFKLALDYRMQFKKDVFIDLIGYRRHGHNELDQPSFTQPLMYKIISNRKPIFELYAQRLVQEGVLTQAQVEQAIKNCNQNLEQAFERSRTQKFESEGWLLKPAQDILEPTKHGKPRDTGVDISLLKDLSKKINVLPNNITPHSLVKKVYEARHHSVETGKDIDWATGEALAFASLVTDGYSIRLSGEDVERGTFSHRHAVVFDQVSDKQYTPIKQLLPQEEQHKVIFSNSHLSEFGVLGFEYGYSIANPNCLTLWEGQFGDFANEAQVIIDNFIVSGESKWGVNSGLVMLLPHGYDGQGPEHSSARLERFLELSDDNPFNILSNADYKADKDRPIRETNIQVCIPTTSSNYFHLLRRQLRRKFRKPLIIMSPKKLLRHKGANSNLVEFQESYRFRRVQPEAFPDEVAPAKDIKKVVCCTGQVYFDLLDARRKNSIKNVVLVRLEQIAPFPYDRIRELLVQYPKAEINWCQEEHFNMGAWGFVQPRFNKVEHQFWKRQRDLSLNTSEGSHHLPLPWACTSRITKSQMNS